MKTRMLSATSLIGTLAMTVSGTTQPAFAANPNVNVNVNDTVEPAGGEDLKASKHSGTNVDYGLAEMKCLSDDRSSGLPGSNGHIATDLGADTDDDRQSFYATPPAFIAGLSATSAAGAFAPS